ncbi:MAG: tyrosine-protein phosphatase [Chlamydiales bacterium]|nr:tyrosine-protein phosphatase [Chlamydiales bacterium]
MIIGQLNCLKGYFTQSQKEQDVCAETASKVLKISGLILGLGGVLAAASFAIPLTLKGAVALSMAVSCAAFFVFYRTHSINSPDKPSLPSADPVKQPEDVSLQPSSSVKLCAKTPIKELWDRLEEKTRSELGKMTYVNLGNRCRFDGIKCPKHTAISVDGNYLHANSITIPGCSRLFVASQAPLPEDCGLFWQAVFERNADIIDLTTPEDRKHKGKEQVTSYYPQFSDQAKTYGPLSVTIENRNDSACCYQVRHLETGEEKRIVRSHSYRWKDFGAVAPLDLKAFVETIDIVVPKGRVAWIHCRAGVGRTGTLIAAYCLREKFWRGELSLENLEEVLIECIVELRQQRGKFFVQQPVQLELLREYGRLLLSSEL